MANFEYKHRIADQLLASKLRSAGAVLIQGPKWCGKSTTAIQQAKSYLMLGNPQTLRDSRTLLNIDSSLIMNGKTPRLFDEWQTIPELWDTIRSEVDTRHELGQFILTGSAVPLETTQIQHTGTGRFAWLRMRPMSLWESEESNGAVSLGELFSGLNKKVLGEKKMSTEVTTAPAPAPASKFDGGLLGLIGINLLVGFLAGITLGIGIPWGVCIRERWI